MTREQQWRDEWAVLRAERHRARRKWRGASGALAARARDPLGLARIVRDHPVAAGGIGAVLGALLVKLLAGRSASARDERSGRDANGRPSSIWSALLRDVAISVALPWIVRVVKAKFGWDLGAMGAPQTEPASRPEASRDAAPEETRA